MTAVAENVMTFQRTEVKPPSVGRLTMVELRKMSDTRAGRWMLASVGLVIVALVTARVFSGSADDRNIESFLSFASAGPGLLLPVVGILAVTSEWGQRTVLTTFTLVPRRSRVLVAKLLATVAITLLALVVSVAAAVLGNVAAEVLNRGGGWELGVDSVVYTFVFLLLNMLMGVAFGALLLASGLAIVLYFVMPTAWTILGSTIGVLKDASQWLDLSTTSETLLTGQMVGDDWAKLATSAALWVILPLAAGLIRILRHEVK